MVAPKLLRVLILVGFAAAGAALPGALEAVVFLLPLLAIVVPLLFGVYVGEERLLARRAARARRPRAARVTAPVRPDVSALRGGLLIAASLAERPPPAAASA